MKKDWYLLLHGKVYHQHAWVPDLGRGEVMANFWWSKKFLSPPWPPSVTKICGPTYNFKICGPKASHPCFLELAHVWCNVLHLCSNQVQLNQAIRELFIREENATTQSLIQYLKKLLLRENKFNCVVAKWHQHQMWCVLSPFRHVIDFISYCILWLIQWLGKGIGGKYGSGLSYKP